MTSGWRRSSSGAVAVAVALGPDGVLSVLAAAVVIALVTSVDALVVPPATVAPYAVVGGLLLALAAVLERSRKVVRVWLPFVVLYLCYRALRGVLLLLPADAGRHDALRAADEALLGVSPAWWFEGLARPWLTEVMAVAYALMFVLPLVVLLGLTARGQERALREAALALLLAFYLGFVGFLLVPARSPDVVYAFATPLTGHGFYEASMAAWARLQQITFDAFPSMHTAISTIALVHARRHGAVLAPGHPRLVLALFVPAVATLQVATLYLRQHYFVDLVAAWALAALALTLAARLCRRWDRWAGGA
ncbi:MAG: phosphatase PAP2 family protein [Kofleriaceae bacterium]|nr:phosphatase PAP2 family protein [Kofleriaceae bacterium]MCL4228111.1 phosphatase PAP2 family protein [Myxococcales bacterium]